MNETEFLSPLLPSSPDFQPIIQALREKYNLYEVDPEGEPISEIYLEDKLITLQEFRQEIENMIRGNLDFMPPDTAKLYKSAKTLSEGNGLDALRDLAMLPDELKQPLVQLITGIKDWMTVMFKILDAQIISIANMLYVFILTGETDEIPNDWFSKVATLTISGDRMVMAMASQLVHPDTIVAQFRQEYTKTFGAYRPKITKTMKSTAYFMQLQRMGKPWNFIVEEFIRLNKYSLPRDRSSRRYFDTWHRYEQRLRKRIQRSEEIMTVLLADKKT
jgi:hypothetical protein